MAVSIIKIWLKRLRQYSITEGDTSQVAAKKLSAVIISISTCIAAPIWVWLYYNYFGLTLPTMGPAIYFLVVMPCLAFFFVSKKVGVLINAQLCCIFSMPVMMEWTSGGFASGTVIIWSFLAPVGGLMFKGIKQGSFWMILFVLAVIVTIVFHDVLLGFSKPVSKDGQALLYGLNIIGPGLVTWFSMQYFVKTIIKNGLLLKESNGILSATLLDLQREKQKTDDLLLNILPYEVAEELKQKGESEPHLYDNVSVLFTDFVGFTSISEKLSAKELVNEIHQRFIVFDQIIERHGLEKIKTIGDAYMAVCGLPNSTTQHAQKTVKAAIEIRAFIENRVNVFVGDDETPNEFHIRIGVHSGPVVAGIVGLKKFAFDIWGDTVNTAARMEQHGVAGKINISGATHLLVKNDFNCTYRGKIEAKNKGEIDMYFVE